MKTGLDIRALAQKIHENQQTKADLIAPVSQIEMGIDTHGANGAKHAVIHVPHSVPGLPHLFPVQSIAHDQIGSYAGIPAKYYDRMLADEPELLAKNVNTWLRRGGDDKRMVRTMRGQNRAFLSNRYQRIENEEIAEVALPILMNTPGLRVVSTEVTERRLYIQATTDRIYGDVKVGDTVQAGLVITNSEVGMGSVSVRALMYRLRCLNGMVTGDNFRAAHLGKRIDDNEALYADDTKKADDHAILLKVRDTVQGFLSAEFFNRKLVAMRALTEGKISGSPEKAIEVLAQKLEVNEVEKNGILRSLIEGADLSRWGILNAVTHQAHSDKVTYDRAVDFEAMGGKLLDLPATEWKQVLEAA